MKTVPFNKKELIELLLADMRSRKLLMGLEKAGLSSEDFYTGLCYIILGKMGFDGRKDEAIYIWYEETMQTILEQELFYFREKQQQLAKRMYQLLVEKKYEIYPAGTNPRKAAALRLLEWFVKR